MPSQSPLLALLVLAVIGAAALQVLTLLYLRRALRRAARHDRRRSRQLRQLSDAVAGQRRQVSRATREVVVQVEALMDLYALVSPRASMPSTQGWAAAPTTMQALVRTVLERSPSTVVECGSGSSSVWLGYALRRSGQGRCVSLEHDAAYAEATRALLRSHGLEDVVEVRLAPLTTVRVGDESYLWYDPAALADLHDVGVVFVDGPPGGVGPLARFPALPLLEDHCADDAVFLLDDTSRPEESMVHDRWTAEHGAQHVGESTSGTGWRCVALGSRPATSVDDEMLSVTPAEPPAAAVEPV